MSILSATTPVLGAATKSAAVTGKGLLVEADVILGRAIKPTTPPSFAALKDARFTLVGTSLYPALTNSDLNAIAKWIHSAHDAGLNTTLSIGWRLNSTTATESAVAFTKFAATQGANMVDLDELIANYKISRAQLLAVINAGLEVNPQLQFIITEYIPEDLVYAYAWTYNYTMVQIASDSYNTQSIIDLNANLAQKYNKTPMSWLIFSKEGDFDCYAHLNNWLQYMKQKNVRPLFYEVDSWGTWQRKWTAVQNY
jgi:hypothetical protein